MDWAGRLLDLTLSGVALGLRTDLGHVKHTAQARLAEFNPLRTISANHDLLRALRLSWVRAAIETLDHALDRCRHTEWRSQRAEIEGFDAVARPLLRAIRSAAYNRTAHPGELAIDAALQPVLVGVADLIGGAATQAPDVLGSSFAATLAALVQWPVRELPQPLLDLALHGVPLHGHRGAQGVQRSFGELVFAEFADLIKDPKKYPEAGAAFQVAMAGAARTLAEDTLAVVRGLDARLDAALPQLDALQALRDGLAHDSAQLAALRSDVAAVPEATVNALMQRLQAEGLVPGFDPRTLIALAQRLTPDEVRDVGRAVVELQHAVDVATRVMATRTQAGSDDADVEALLAHVAERTREGRLDAGSELLEDALADLDQREAEQAAAVRRKRHALLEAGARQELLRRDPFAVASRLEALAALETSAAPALSEDFIARTAAFFQEGLTKGVSLSLQVALEMARRTYEAAQQPVPRRAAAQMLGQVLVAVGERDADDACLGEALALRREQQAQTTLQDDAQAQVHRALAQVLYLLGERRGDIVLLLEGLELQRRVLTVLQRPQAPREWAAAQHELGQLLSAVGRLQGDAVLLHEAAAAFGEAVKVRTRAAAPTDWGRSQRLMGVALAHLSRIDGHIVTFQRSVAAFREAVKGFSVQTEPLMWARCQANLGSELAQLAQQTKDARVFQESIDALQAALTVYSADNHPIGWAMAHHNLGGAYMLMGELLGEDAPSYEHAVTAYRVATRHFDSEHTPVYWSAAHTDLAQVLSMLARARNDAAPLLEAERAARAALQLRQRAGSPGDVGMTLNTLGAVLHARADLLDDREVARQAAEHYREALHHLAQSHGAINFAAIESHLAELQARFG